MRSSLAAVVLGLSLVGCASGRAVRPSSAAVGDEMAPAGLEEAGDAALDRKARLGSYCLGLKEGAGRWAPDGIDDEAAAKIRGALLAAFDCAMDAPLLVTEAEAEAGRSFAAGELADEELRLRLAAASGRLASLGEADERRVLAEQLVTELRTRAEALPPAGERIATERARLGLPAPTSSH